MPSDVPLRYSSKDAVVCRGVGKTWAAGTKRAHQALRDIDLDVKPGEFVVFLGPSGCGKSTLLSLATGLRTPSTGEVLVGSLAADGLNQTWRRTGIDASIVAVIGSVGLLSAQVALARSKRGLS